MAALSTGNFEELNFETREIGCKWTIDDFITKQPHMQDVVDSQTFPGEDLPQWCIQLRPRGDTKGAETRKFGVFLWLKKAEDGEKSVVVNYNLQFLNDHDAQIAGTNKISGKKFDEGKCWGFAINSDSNEPIPLSTSRKLIIRVTIWIRKPVKSIPKSSMNGDLMKLLKTAEFSDFIIESADGHEFPVHKAILAVRNPHFFALLKTEMKEAGDNRVKLPFEGEIVSSLLEYLYSDEVVNLTPTAARLYPVAHQYQLDRLILICAENLCQNLTVNNVFVSLRIAKLFEDAKLMSACQKFIAEHKDVAVQMVSAAAFNDDSDPKSDA